MTEKEFALKLKTDYEDAQQAFGHQSIVFNLAKLKDVPQLDFVKLQEEVSKLGYICKMAKEIKTRYWQNQAKKAPYAVFYLTEKDL